MGPCWLDNARNYEGNRRKGLESSLRFVSFCIDCWQLGRTSFSTISICQWHPIGSNWQMYRTGASDRCSTVGLRLLSIQSIPCQQSWTWDLRGKSSTDRISYKKCMELGSQTKRLRNRRKDEKSIKKYWVHATIGYKLLQIVTNCYNVRAIWSEVRNAATAEVGYAMIRLDRPVASRGPSVPPSLHGSYQHRLRRWRIQHRRRMASACCSIFEHLGTQMNTLGCPRLPWHIDKIWHGLSMSFSNFTPLKVTRFEKLPWFAQLAPRSAEEMESRNLTE